MCLLYRTNKRLKNLQRIAEGKKPKPVGAIESWAYLFRSTAHAMTVSIKASIKFTQWAAQEWQKATDKQRKTFGGAIVALCVLLLAIIVIASSIPPSDTQQGTPSTVQPSTQEDTDSEIQSAIQRVQGYAMHDPNKKIRLEPNATINDYYTNYITQNGFTGYGWAAERKDGKILVAYKLGNSYTTLMPIWVVEGDKIFSTQFGSWDIARELKIDRSPCPTINDVLSDDVKTNEREEEIYRDLDDRLNHLIDVTLEQNPNADVSAAEDKINKDIAAKYNITEEEVDLIFAKGLGGEMEARSKCETELNALFSFQDK